MSFLYRADTKIYDPFSNYIDEQSTLRSKYLAIGLVSDNPVIAQNVTKGDKFKIPNWAPNLSGSIQIPAEGVPLSVNKLTSAEQVGVIFHRANVWGSSELAKLAVGSENDPMQAIARRVTDYVLNAQQADLLSVLSGVFGALGSSNSGAAFASMCVDASGSGETDLSPRHIVLADAILGEDADTFGAMVVHPDVYAYLRVREMINYVSAKELPGITASTIAAGSITGINAFGGDYSNAFGTSGQVPMFGSKAVIVSDDAPRTGSAGSYKYGIYVFKQGAIGQAFQAPVRTEADRDILTSGGEDILKVQWDMCYHPLGASWGGGTNPSAADLATAGNWSKVFSNKNIGVARITATCPLYV
jgi:hypothetical protein